MTKILAFSASNHAQSINKQLLAAAIEKIAGQEIQSIDIRDFPMPIFGLDEEKQEGFPTTSVQLKDLFSEAEAFIFSIPEHNGSMPAIFKNTIDWLSRIPGSDGPFLGSKPVLLLSTSPGPRGGATNLQTLTQIMPYWGASTIDSYSLGSFYDNFSAGKFSADKDSELTAAIEAFINKL